MKENKRKKSFIKRSSERGTITVLVSLIMIPVFVITGLFVDFSRYALGRSQATMVADAYGEAVLSEYDNVLKNLYGLFSVTQSEDGKNALDSLDQEILKAYHPEGDGAKLYDAVETELAYENVDDSSFENTDVLLTQISQFMRYRGIINLMSGENDILGSLASFSHVEEDKKAGEEYQKLAEKCKTTLDSLEKYRDDLKTLMGFPDDIRKLKEKFAGYIKDATDMINDKKEIAGYKYSEIYDHFKPASEGEGNESTQDTSADTEEGATENTLEEDVKKYGDKYLEDYDNVADSCDSILSDYQKVFDSLRTDAGAAETSISELIAKYDEIMKIECSNDMKEGIKSDTEHLGEVKKFAGALNDAAAKILDTNKLGAACSKSKIWLHDRYVQLWFLFDDIFSGKAEEGDVNQSAQNYYDFDVHNDAVADVSSIMVSGTGGFSGSVKSLHDELNTWLKSGSSNSEEDRARGIKDRADEKYNEVSGEDDPSLDDVELRDVPNLDGLVSTSAIGSADGFLRSMSGGLKGVANTFVDDLLLLSYEKSMFTSRMTDVVAAQTDENGKRKMPVSETGYAETPDINYLYGAEIEYLLVGNKSSRKNLNTTRNIIVGTRYAMNFTSTFLISEINDPIKAAASAASAVGTPLAGIIVSALLRAAVAGVETYADWQLLKKGEKTTFMKREFSQLSSDDAIIQEVCGKSAPKEKTKDLELGYDDYTTIMLVFSCMGGNENILNRTSNLITLNVNQAQNEGGGLLTSLDFKMKDTVTAVKSTCRVKMKYIFVSPGLMNSILGTTSSRDNSYTGFSVYRGY